MHHVPLSSLMVTVVLAAAGCSTEPEAPPIEASRSFVVASHNETTLDVTLSAGGGSVRLLAVETQPSVIDVTFDFGDPVIAYRIDRDRGRGDFMPSGAPLDALDLRLIDQLAAELDQLVPQDAAERWRVEDAVMRQTSLMQIAPMGERLEATTFTAQQGWTHISCSCFNQYIGGGYYRTAGRGCGCTGGSGNGCKGRCGQGCGITSTPKCVGSTAYTQDCARHDWGVGSWASASDDYSFAGNNCSCSGVGTCY